MKFKINRNKIKKTPTLKVGVRKNTTVTLWALLAISLLFGVYKNFTAINKHTIHEKQIVEKQVVDTNKIERFVENFVNVYYSWNHSQIELDHRSEKLKGFLTEELQNLNTDVIRNDIPTQSVVNKVQIWKVTEIDTSNFKVLYSVEQKIIEDDNSNTVTSTFEITVHCDNSENMVIIKNPTISSQPHRSSFTPKQVESDGTVDVTTSNEITDFLKTFFKLYPTANAKELAYYVNGNVLKPIGKDYIFVEIVDAVYQKMNNQVAVKVTVKYLDKQSKAVQISQFEFLVEKNGNWKITNSN